LAISNNTLPAPPYELYLAILLFAYVLRIYIWFIEP
jgi:hypothetical protein